VNIEHFALNVRDPVEMAKWYVEHIGMKIVKKRDHAPFTTFLSDNAGSVMLELYCNPENEVPDYPHMNPLIVHIAFSDDNPQATKTRLIAARATCIEEVDLPDGSHLVMMRDPWGLAIQFCRRGAGKGH
jgi:glyoxylase I family protein